jgi:hypothetical protein
MVFMNKIKEHSKKLAALLSAFQFFGSGAQKTRGMFDSMGKAFAEVLTDPGKVKGIIKGLAGGLNDAETTNNLKDFIGKIKRAIGSNKIVDIDDNIIATAYQEIFNPTKNNETFRYDFAKELQKVWNAGYNEAINYGLPEETLFGGITGLKSLEDMGYKEQKDKEKAAKCWAIIKCLEKQKTLMSADTMAHVIGRGAVKTLGIFSLEVAAVILGIKYGGQQIDRFMDSRACKAEQREFDRKMKEQMGESSVDFTKSWEKIEKELNELRDEYPHNKDVINKIIELVHGYYVGVQLSIQNADEDKTKDDEDKGLLISISGEPGSGKTSFCKKLAKILGAINPVSIGLNSFDVSNKQVSAVQQINGKWWVGSPNRGHYEYGPLVSVALHNEHPIWIQDEADKSPIELLNVLWDISDSASFEVAGEKKKCKGTIVLMPLNTSLLDNPNISQNEMLKNSIGRRIHEFYFHNPDKESYKIALIRMLKKLSPEINKKYGTKFKYTDKSLEFLVEKCVKDNIAMGSIENCKLLILSVVDSIFRRSEGKKPLSLELSYDEATSSLFCKKNFDENNKKDEKIKKEK